MLKYYFKEKQIPAEPETVSPGWLETAAQNSLFAFPD